MVQGTGYMVQDIGYWVYGTGLWVLGIWYRVRGPGYWVYGTGLLVLGIWYRVRGSGFWFQGKHFRDLPVRWQGMKAATPAVSFYTSCRRCCHGVALDGELRGRDVYMCTVWLSVENLGLRI